MKIALGTATDLFASFSGRESDKGDDFDDAESLTALRRVSLDRDPNRSNRTTLAEGTLGFRHDMGVGSSFTAALQVRDSKTVIEDPDAPDPQFPDFLQRATRIALAIHGYDLQAQQVIRLGQRHQLVAGVGAYVNDQEFTDEYTVFEPMTGFEFLRGQSSDTTRAHGYAVWLRDEMELSSSLHLTAGARFQENKGRDIFAEAPSGGIRR